MFTRLKAGIVDVANKIKTGGGIVLSAIPGIAIVAARAGSGVFNAAKFSDYLAQILNLPILGSQLPIGIILSSVGLIGAGVTNVYTRFFNSYRRGRSSKKNLPTPQPKNAISTKLLNEDSSDVENQTVSEEKQQITPTCCSPGIGPRNIRYTMAHMVYFVYGFGSGSSGVLSMNSLINLMQLWLKFEYDGTCGENQSEAYKIVVANTAMALLIFANVLSFIFYNVPALREYYVKLFIQKRLFTDDGQLFLDDCELKSNDEVLSAKDGFLYNDETGEIILKYTDEIFTHDGRKLSLKNGWSEISYLNRASVFFGASLGTIGIWYGNHNLVGSLNSKTLCHIGWIIPDTAITINAAVGSSTFFAVTSMMTFGALFNKQEKARQVSPTEQIVNTQNSKSVFGCMENFIRLSVTANAFNIGLGTFVAFTSLPETLLGLQGLANHGAVIGGGIFAGVASAYCQVTNDGEGVERERLARIKLLKEAKETQTANTSETTTPELNSNKDSFYHYPVTASISINRANHDPRLFRSSSQLNRGSINRKTMQWPETEEPPEGIGFLPSLSRRASQVTT